MSEDSKELTVNEPDELSLNDLELRVRKIQAVMRSVMKVGQHYGIIPGTDKPGLLKPGAEKLALIFRLAPEFKIDSRELPNGHRDIQVVCRLVHIPTGQVFGEGVGSCSTMESKYRWRGGKRICPECGKGTIIKSKKEYGGGWLCWDKKGGCGFKWRDGAIEIEGQPTERVENPDIADTYNTVLKMAKKRAQVDATLTATAASDIFTQDVDDQDEETQSTHELIPPVQSTKPASSAREESDVKIQAIFLEVSKGGQTIKIELPDREPDWWPIKAILEPRSFAGVKPGDSIEMVIQRRHAEIMRLVKPDNYDSI